MKRCIGRMGVFALSVLSGCGILLSKAQAEGRASPLATGLSQDFVFRHRDRERDNAALCPRGQGPAPYPNPRVMGPQQVDQAALFYGSHLNDMFRPLTCCWRSTGSSICQTFGATWRHFTARPADLRLIPNCSSGCCWERDDLEMATPTGPC